MRFLFFIGATLLVSGCNALPPQKIVMPDMNDNPCFNRLFDTYSSRIKSNKSHYRMIDTFEGIKMCSVNLSGGTDAYLLYDPKAPIYWHDYTRSYESEYNIKTRLEKNYTQWLKEQSDKLCAADISCMTKKKYQEEAHLRQVAKTEKILEERKSKQMKQCLPYAKDLSSKIPSLLNPRVQTASGNGVILFCLIKFDQKTIYGTLPKIKSLTINTANGAYEYQ
ncbi:TPA: hypothetical protein ACSPZ7_004084 [Aeromonas veronii]